MLESPSIPFQIRWSYSEVSTLESISNDWWRCKDHKLVIWMLLGHMGACCEKMSKLVIFVLCKLSLSLTNAVLVANTRHNVTTERSVLTMCYQRRADTNSVRAHCDTFTCHDDVIKWKHFPCNWPLVRGIHRSPVNFPHKWLVTWSLMFSLVLASTNG